jgi:hypothetical protein
VDFFGDGLKGLIHRRMIGLGRRAGKNYGAA